jgi:hypothetical protein
VIQNGAEAGGIKELRPSPAGKNLTSSVSALFCFRAFRPGPRFSFFVGSNLRPMVLGKIKTEDAVARVGKGTQDACSATSVWETVPQQAPQAQPNRSPMDNGPCTSRLTAGEHAILASPDSCRPPKPRLTVRGLRPGHHAAKLGSTCTRRALDCLTPQKRLAQAQRARRLRPASSGRRARNGRAEVLPRFPAQRGEVLSALLSLPRPSL